uniref:Peptide ABC transporter substrate-binding protein n=1 Tax=Conchiformibius kuhniae TaxID=211502 RepID=A0A8T9MUE7_9NEIS|nr:peptide ABC transporter substrate-binding protein [Conchiformibius kuhniae]UOP04126.1 peptide ABC transporter substrate-binding protein [Conchiformibius kuhniae]
MKNKIPPPAAETAAAPSAAPAAKNNVIIDIGAEPSSLDPHKASDSGAFDVMRQMLLGLVAADGEGKTVPALAEKWESADNKVWTFHLRDAKWNNGDPVTADDFVFSLRRLTDPATGSPYGGYLVDAKVENAAAVNQGKAKPETLGVKALDAKTLQITLSEAVPYFPDMMLLPVTYAVHAKTVQQHGDKWTQPEHYVANAAYKLKEWTVNSQIVLERNPDFYDNAQTDINEIVFLPITDASASLNRYRAGELDFAAVPPAQFQQVKDDAVLGKEMRVRPRLCTFYYEPNIKQPKFADAKVRRALMLSLDRETIAGKVLGRGETPAYQFTPPSINDMGDAAMDWRGWDKAKRIEEAKKLLAEAGYGAGKPLRFEILYNTSDVSKQLVSASMALWKEALGADWVDIQAVNQEWKTFLDTKRAGKFDVGFSGWCADYNEPSSFLNMMRTGNGNNSNAYANPEFDALLDKTLSAPDAAARQKLYHDAERVLIDQDAGMVPVFHRVSVSVLKPYVLGFSGNDPMGNYQIKDWELSR